MDIPQFDKKEILGLGIVLVLAIFFRFWALSSVPPGLYSDEAINGNQALAWPKKLFYQENNGREGLFINLLAVSLRVFGPSITSLRIVPAFFGTLTVLGLYFLAKELFGKKNAIFSSFFLAISFWHINFSRIVFRAILTPFCLVYAFLFLTKGLKNESKKDLVVGGIFFGLGFYTYTAYRFSVLILLVLFGAWYLIYKGKNKTKDYFIYIAYCLGSSFLVALPIAVYFLLNPSYLFSRIAGISVFTQAQPLLALSESLVKHLAMFNFAGDPNWRHNIANQPVLFWPIGILFLFGLAYSLVELFFAFKNKKYVFGTAAYALIIFWFFIMLLPGILTYEGIPHSLRTIGALPPVFIFAGLGLSVLTAFFSKYLSFKNKQQKIIILFAATCFIFSLVLSSFYRYFSVWGRNKETGSAFSKNYVEIGRLLNTLGPKEEKYIVVKGVDFIDETTMSTQTPRFIEQSVYGKVRGKYITENEISEIERGVIIPLDYDIDTIARILESFPLANARKDKGVFYLEVN